MVNLIRKGQEEEEIIQDMDPKLIVAGGVAMMLGLLVFEKYILQGTGLDDVPVSDIFDKIVAAWAALFLS